MARRPRVAGGVPHRFGARAPPRPWSAAGWSGRAREGLVDWPAVERSRSGGCERAPGTLSRRRAPRRPSRPTPRRWPASCRRSRPRSGRELPGVVERSGVVDRAGWVRANTGVLRVAHRQAREGPARPGRAARRRPRQGDDGPREPLDHDPPARAAARVHGPARARPVRHRAAVGRGRARAGCCSSRRTSARRRARWACRSGRSGPGSRSTRRPTRSSSRRIRGCGPYLASRLERQLALFGGDVRGFGRDALRGARSGAARRGRRRALDGAAHGRGAAAPVPRDAGGDEPARGLQRLRHGRGRRRTSSRTSSRSAPGSTSGASGARRSSGRCSG